MAMVVRAYPLVASVEEVEGFAAAVCARRAEAVAFFRQFGVSHESWHVQETPAGPQIICVTILEDSKVAADKYAASSQAFDTWYKGEVVRLSGIDPNNQPLGPPSKQIFEWPPAVDAAT